MATLYVRSSDGNNADDGSTWALAKATIAGAGSASAAGDRIFVSDNHAESTAGAITATFAGTMDSPCLLLCGDDAAEPPTSLSTAGTVASTGASNITLSGHFYAYGLSITAGSGAVNASLILSNGAQNKQKYDNCVLALGGTGGTGSLCFGPPGGTSTVHEVELVDCSIKFGGSGQALLLCCNGKIRGGGAAAGGTSPSSFVEFGSGEPMLLTVDGFDFSAWDAGLDLVQGGAITAAGRVIFRNCKLPASWSGTLVSADMTTPGLEVEAWNCDDGDTNYGMWIERYTGSVRDEIVIVRSGGASDGDTPLSWKMATSSRAEYPLHVLRSPEIYVPNTTVGSPITLTVEIVHDSTTALDNDEVWLEVQYLGTSGFPKSSFADDAVADVLATPAAQASSSVTWTTTGITNVNKQALAVTVTPQEEGVMICTVCVAKASYTVYVCPKVDVS